MSDEITCLLTLPQYRDQRQHLFPSDGSLTWFIRRHRDALVKAGAYLMIAGRRQVNPARFDEMVLKVGAQDAASSHRELAAE